MVRVQRTANCDAAAVFLEKEKNQSRGLIFRVERARVRNLRDRLRRAAA